MFEKANNENPTLQNSTSINTYSCVDCEIVHLGSYIVIHAMFKFQKCRFLSFILYQEHTILILLKESIGKIAVRGSDTI